MVSDDECGHNLSVTQGKFMYVPRISYMKPHVKTKDIEARRGNLYHKISSASRRTQFILQSPHLVPFNTLDLLGVFKGLTCRKY